MTLLLDPKKRFSIYCLLLLLILLLYWVYVMVLPFSKPLLWAILLSISFQPVFKLIEQRVKNSSGAALLTILLMLLVVMGPLIFLGIKGANEGRQLYLQLEEQSRNEGGWSNYYNRLVEEPLNWVAQKTGVATPDLRELLLNKIKAASTASLSWASSLVSNVLTTIGSGLLVLFIMFFLLRGGKNFRQMLLSYVPMEPNRMEELLKLVAAAIVANLYGMVAIAGLQGLLLGIGFAIVQLPSPVIWGTMACFASLIPLVGTSIVWLPGVILLVADKSYGRAVFLALWSLLLVGMVDNILRPLIIKKGVKMSTLLVFFALMGGLQTFGPIGLFAGPIIFSVTQAVFRILRDEQNDLEKRWVAAAERSVGENSVPETPLGE